MHKNIVKFQVVCYIALIMFAFSACKTTKPTSKPPVRPPTTTVPPKPDPKKEEVKEDDIDDVVKMSFALVMPFELRENFAPVSDDMAEPTVSQSSLQALNFYEGAIMAIDTLASEKREITMSAYDAPVDSAGIARLFSNAVLKSANYVIASFSNHLVPVAASIASKNNINLILTQASSPSFLEENEQVVLSLASTLSQCREMVKAMFSLYPGSNAVLVYRSTKREEELAEAFRNEIKQSKSVGDFHDINTQDKGLKEVTSALSKTKRNIVFVVSSDEAFVNPLLNQIEEQNIFGVMISGLPTWQHFESIDFMNFKNISVHIFDNSFIDYENSSTSTFRKQFIKRFSSDPMPSAFHGFDMVYNLTSSGKLPKDNPKKSILASFKKDEPGFRFEEFRGGGLENTSITVLQFKDYKLERIQIK